MTVMIVNPTTWSISLVLFDVSKNHPAIAGIWKKKIAICRRRQPQATRCHWRRRRAGS